MLKDALDHVEVNGTYPVTQHQWQLIEQSVKLRTAAVQLRVAWEGLAKFATDVPELPGRDEFARAIGKEAALARRDSVSAAASRLGGAAAASSLSAFAC